MKINAKFVQANLVATDWRGLAHFYEKVIGCIPVHPERNFSGRLIDDLTGKPDSRIRGVHLKLPGYEGKGPTLEVFQYDRVEKHPETVIIRPGFSHLAFQVDDVETARDAIIGAGENLSGRRLPWSFPRRDW